MPVGGELHTLLNIDPHSPLSIAQPISGAGQPSSVHGHGPLSSHGGAAKTCAAIPAARLLNSHHDEAGAEVYWFIWQTTAKPLRRRLSPAPRHTGRHVGVKWRHMFRPPGIGLQGRIIITVHRTFVSRCEGPSIAELRSVLVV